jgi:hypothetical protein
VTTDDRKARIALALERWNDRQHFDHQDAQGPAAGTPRGDLGPDAVPLRFVAPEQFHRHATRPINRPRRPRQETEQWELGQV